MRNNEQKKNLVVIFGGKSVEHDISIITGVQTLNAINKNKYNVIPIYINKDGEFLTSNLFYDIKIFTTEDFLKKSKKVIFSTDSYLYVLKGKNFKKLQKIDFAILATHGGLGENGGLQGYLDMCNIPYSSPNLFASNVCMNKIATKQILKENNIPIVDYLIISQVDFNKNFDKIKEKIKELKYPVIVKPANLGSSVGISFCKSGTSVKNAISFALLFDKTVIIEKAVENLREFNISVIGNGFNCELSNIEEVFIKKDFLTFENKYLNNKSNSKGMENTKRKIPAELPLEVENQIKYIAKEVFLILDCKGIVRFDFLFDDKSQKVYFNEVNTIPGSLSNYLWTKNGYNFEKLLEKIIKYSLENKKEIDSKITNFSSNVLRQFKNSSKLDLKK